MRAFLIIAVLLATSACHHWPRREHQPVIRNPFPQLSRVAVAPFFNLSDEPTVDGRRFAIAYYNELQATAGFEVIPLAVTEAAIRQHGIRLDDPSEARRLAQILDVDAVAVGAVTDYSPYYPPRLGLTVEWWGANPCYLPIPPGYGLPWGTTEEEYIPEPIVYETEMALARKELNSGTPPFTPEPTNLPAPPAPELLPVPDAPMPVLPPQEESELLLEVAPVAHQPGDASSDVTDAIKPAGADWRQSDEPVLRHTYLYHSNDSDFTAALQTYELFRDDARFGGWEAYLQRSDDFIRFCCHLHITEMLSARGGAGKTRVVWRWPHDR